MAADAPPATTVFAEVDGLRKRYPGARDEAVKGISFGIERGEVFGLLGPNGAGKTTTIGVMTTRVRPTGGAVRIDGIDVVRDPVAVKQRIAVVPQRPNLDRTLTAIENLTFHGAYFGWGLKARRARAHALMDELGLQGRGGDKVDNYSGGMAQRLMIARALMHDPAMLFLDEPTTGLDPQSRLFLWDRIEALRDRGVTILLTTHDMVEAERLCARIAIVDHGEVIALDTPRGLRSLLKASEGVDVTVAATEDPAGAFAALGETKATQAEPGRWEVHVRGEADVRAAIAAAESAGLEVLDVRRVESTLEDVFVSLTGRDLR